MTKRALLAVLALVVPACGGTTEAVPVAQAPIAACLTFVVDDASTSGDVYDRDVQGKVRAAVEAAMVGAGFNVVADPALPHDLDVRLVTTPGSRIETGARVHAELVLEREGKVIARLEAKAPQDDSGYDGVVADTLIDSLFRSPDLAKFTRDLRNPKSKEHLAASALRVAMAGQDKAAPSEAEQKGAADKACPKTELATPAAPSATLAGTAQPKAFAFIVGAESYGKGSAKAAGATKDAEAFEALAKTTLGVPAEQIKMALGEKADKLAFDLNLEWLKLNVPEGGRIYFYYSGFGAVRRRTMTPFLLPYKGDPDSLDKTAVNLPVFLDALIKTKAASVVAFIDAGFSGQGPRSAMPKDGHSLGSLNPPDVPLRTSLFIATKGVEHAYPAEGDKGGLFTHYLLEGLGRAKADIDGDGAITLEELSSWAGPRVGRDAKRRGGGGTQSPVVIYGPGMPGPSPPVLATGLPSE